jgi:type II secretion system protein H
VVAVKAAAVRGFTLIEVMVVMVIIGIMAGMAVSLMRPDPGRAAEAEAWRLARLAERLGREAEMTGQVLALSWTVEGYEFTRRDDDGNWVPLDSDSVFEPRRFEPGVRLADSGEVRFAPDGEREPRRWLLITEVAEVAVSLSALGEATVERQVASGNES